MRLDDLTHIYIKHTHTHIHIHTIRANKQVQQCFKI